MSLQNLSDFTQNQLDLKSNNIQLGLPPEYALSRHPIDKIITEINDNNVIYFNNNNTDLTSNNNYSNYNFEQTSLQGQLEQTPLSNHFFSEINFRNLNDTIRYKVYEKTTHVISDVSIFNLYDIMRSIFLNWSDFISCDIKGQIEILNKKVVDYAVDVILSELHTYMEYIKDLSTNNLSIMDYPLWMGRNNYTFDMTNIPT